MAVLRSHVVRLPKDEGIATEEGGAVTCVDASPYFLKIQSKWLHDFFSSLNGGFELQKQSALQKARKFSFSSKLGSKVTLAFAIFQSEANCLLYAALFLAKV